MHMDPKALLKENIQRTIENNQVLNNTYLNVAGAKDRMSSAGSIKEFAEFLTDAEGVCAAEKMRVGYHAHSV